MSTKISNEISKKVALVTGANRGIGKTIVETFLAHGAAKVYLAVRNPESTQALAEKYGDRVVTLKVDVKDADSIAALAESAQDVNIVVNNAGVLVPSGPLDNQVEQALNDELTVNVFGLLRMARAFVPVLEKNGGGAFVQLNSVASIKNFTAFTTYSASKSAAYSITQGLRDELSPKGIQVLSVHPGPIATDMANNAGMGEIAEPADLVARGIVDSLARGDFHLFPDTMAKQFEGAYAGFAEAIIDAGPEE